MKTARLDDMTRGWFVGDFAPSALRTPACEAAVRHYRKGDAESRHLHRIAVHVSAYITHVRTQLKQTIPKAIVHTLVLKAKRQLLDGLAREIAAADDGGLKRMLSEDDATVKRREQCLHRLKLLRQAADEVAACSF